MDAKQWLERARYAEEEIQKLEELKEQTLARLHGGFAAGDGIKVQKSLGNHVEQLMVDYAEMIQEIQTQILEKELMKKEILEALSTLSDARLKIIIISRYLQRKEWEKIADELKYHPIYIQRILHKRALIEIQKYLDSFKKSVSL